MLRALGESISPEKRVSLLEQFTRGRDLVGLYAVRKAIPGVEEGHLVCGVGRELHARLSRRLVIALDGEILGQRFRQFRRDIQATAT